MLDKCKVRVVTRYVHDTVMHLVSILRLYQSSKYSTSVRIGIITRTDSCRFVCAWEYHWQASFNSLSWCVCVSARGNKSPAQLHFYSGWWYPVHHVKPAGGIPGTHGHGSGYVHIAQAQPSCIFSTPTTT